MNKYDLKYIENMRIHELRDLAKKVGVNSPTTMKKEELVLKISENYDGDTDYAKQVEEEVKSEVDVFRVLTGEEGFVDKNDFENNNLDCSNKCIANLSNSEENSYDKYPVKSEVDSSFTFKIKQKEAAYGNDESQEVRGFLDIHPSGYGIIRDNGYMPTENDTFVTLGVIKKNKLKKGNYIVGKSKYFLNYNTKLLSEIIHVDEGCKCNTDFDSYENNGLGEQLYLDKFNLEIRKGERIYIQQMSLDDAVALGYDIVEENSARVKLINIKSRPEDNHKSYQKMQIINIPFNKSEEDIVAVLDLVLECVKREFEMEKSNVIMIYNFSDLMRVLNTIACDGFIDFSKYHARALNKLQEILYMTKHYNEKLHCNIICVDRNGVSKDIKTVFDLECIPLFNNLYTTISKKK